MPYYNPDKFLVLEIFLEGNKYYKVFATWAGSYLQGASWKLSSAIKEIKEDEEFPNCIIAHNLSGSTYNLIKGSYGIAGGFNAPILSNFIQGNVGVVRELSEQEAMNLVGSTLYFEE